VETEDRDLVQDVQEDKGIVEDFVIDVVELDGEAVLAQMKRYFID
jgi:hypothetical protein